MYWFISDLHFEHKRIISLCQRPFRNVPNMDKTLITNWNSRVQNDDTVYIIGDFACRECSSPYKYLTQLKGNKVLIIGNHDPFWLDKIDAEAFSEISYFMHLTLDGEQCTLCHYPMVEWPSSRIDNSESYGFLIHGHIHNSHNIDYNTVFRSPFQLNASVEINDYRPVTFVELQENNEKFKLSHLENAADKAMYIARKYLYNIRFPDRTPLIVVLNRIANNGDDQIDVDVICFLTMLFNHKSQSPVITYLNDTWKKCAIFLNRCGLSVREYMQKISTNKTIYDAFIIVLHELLDRGYIENVVFENEKEIMMALRLK